MTDFYETLNLSLLSSKEYIKNVIMDPSPSQEPPHPPKLQQCMGGVRKDSGDSIRGQDHLVKLPVDVFLIKMV